MHVALTCYWASVVLVEDVWLQQMIRTEVAGGS